MQLEGFLELVPAGERPLEAMSDAELLAHGARQSLLRMIEIIDRLRDPDDIKAERLAGDMANAMVKHFINVQAAGLRGRQNDQLARILAAIAKAGAEPDAE